MLTFKRAARPVLVLFLAIVSSFSKMGETKILRRKISLEANLAEDQAFWGRLLLGTGSVGSISQRAPPFEGLIDPCMQPMFEEIVPNALDPRFIYESANNIYNAHICKNANHQTGLVDEYGKKLSTPIYGYGDRSGVCSWPGMTFEVQSFSKVTIRWENTLPVEEYILSSRDGISVVDTSIHWAYSLPGYDSYTIPENGTPIVTHIHGMRTVSPSDGNPEFFFSPGFKIKGPQWKYEDYIYDNNQPATTSWYHDHTLGITRLNVYAGLAGFYIIRDDEDTGKSDNPLSLPAFPYEAAFAIQDRMFKDNGELFYPAFPGDPSYEDFIVGEGAVLPEDQFPNGGPTALAEFFGDVMLVNGIMWPIMKVEPRNYRLRLLNACDSRFIFVEFFKVGLGDSELPTENAEPIPFTVVADHHGLVYEPKTMTTLMVETGARYDVVINFTNFDGHRVIMKNIGPDEAFDGDEATFNPERVGSFCRMDRIMAFDVIKPFEHSVEDNFNASNIRSSSDIPEPTFKRRVALFEGRDQFGRLLPVLGTVDPATDVDGDPILWPDTEPYQLAGLAGKQIQGTVAWHEPITENPRLDTTEEWEVWNFSGDAHPIHLHMVHFDIIARNEVVWDNSTTEEDRVSDADSATGDGTYLVSQPIVLHNMGLGKGFMVANPTKGGGIGTANWFFEDGPKDVLVALPGTVTTIKAKFDKPGRFVWHCHILSHEDHEMMREFYVRS
jgi:FtsP/CotA-like multicopper oxidase with cupredoxin domain